VLLLYQSRAAVKQTGDVFHSFLHVRGILGGARVGGVAGRLRGYEFEEVGDVTSVAAWRPFANGSQGKKRVP
jgi:hypothetical protein